VFLLVCACFASASCSTTATAKKPRAVALRIDVSDGIMEFDDGHKRVRKIPIETGRRGVGNGYGSYQTPVGNFVVYQKQHSHRFAKNGVGVLRIKDPITSGKTRNEPGRRGVYIHRNLDGKNEGTNGCFCPLDDADMLFVWNNTPVGTTLKVKP
jgi:hypothetical protein